MLGIPSPTMADKKGRYYVEYLTMLSKTRLPTAHIRAPDGSITAVVLADDAKEVCAFYNRLAKKRKRDEHG